MIDPNILYETQFAKDLVTDSTTIAQRLLKAPKDKTPEPTERDTYIHQVLNSFSELEAIRENLDMAEIFLGSYSVSKRWKDRYDQNHYFTYHYEMWIMNAVRFYERLLMLINSVYCLGINDKDVTFKEISQHPTLKNTRTLEVLNELHGALGSLQEAKNRVFHRYQYNDDKLREVARLNFIARYSKNKDEVTKLRRIAELKMKDFYLPEKREEVTNNNIELVKAANILLETLGEQYKRHRDSLPN